MVLPKNATQGKKTILPENITSGRLLMFPLCCIIERLDKNFSVNSSEPQVSTDALHLPGVERCNSPRSGPLRWLDVTARGRQTLDVDKAVALIQ
ncbi:hypothetical protein RRG08_016983 [Elysia crispata]|uniref:Uncharacterized protein n=1 Tax=Elysia crispata TaxID=231223 RepID=A0AAE0XZT5_9GAST|nr:hypothetical protein RRG08_016983 [Elysia crispata]